ncbi:MAG: 1-acyl-sn-glycerol-3-phosphate acyltransferase [Longimicrobiales bacterium]
MNDAPARVVVTRIIGWAASVFQRIEKHGGVVPPGPVLVVANHPNSLLDPLVVFRTAGRPTRPLAKAPLFEQAFVGSMLRLLGGLPVFRKQDDASQMHRNEQTFDAAIDALRSGHAVQIYPEGISHSEPSLVPLRTGAARIAFGAETRSDWMLGLRIVPIGITYRRKTLFRGTALAFVGEAFTITRFRNHYEDDPVAAVQALTTELAHRLEAVTLNVTESEDIELIETADRLYSREKGMQRWREREDMADKLPRLQRFARGLAWLRANDPVRHARLSAAVMRYHRTLTLLGAEAGDVPRSYEVFATIRYVVRESLLLLLGLPFAAAGALVWAPAFVAPRFVLRAVRPPHEAIATYKFATGFVAAPLTALLCAIAAGILAGPGVAVVAFLAAPLLGLVSIAFHERWRRVREDARVFYRALRNRRSVDRLAVVRSSLAADFDRILQEAPGILNGGSIP